MNNAFYFKLKDLSDLKISSFMSWRFGYVGKQLDKKAMVNFKIFGITERTTKNCNTHIAQYLKK